MAILSPEVCRNRRSTTRPGRRTPLALVFASITLALCLLFLTGLLENLPKAVLAAVVLTAILGLFDFRGAAPHVAREPDRLLRRHDRARRGTASRNPAGHSARGAGFDPLLLARASRRMSLSLAASLEPTAIPISPVIRKTSRWGT